MTTEKIKTTNETMNIPLALSTLGKFIDNEIELIKRQTTMGTPAWLVVPIDRKHLQSVLWQHIRLHAPLWDSPETAVIGFAVGIEDWKRTANQWSPERVREWLSQQLAKGAAPALQVMERGVSLGIHPKRIQRASVRLDIQRRKIGFGGVWWWSLPNEDEESLNKGERGHGHQCEAI